MMNDMNNLKVSVLVGTYNRAPFIERCLNGVFNQTHKNIEVIVINDASSDNTIEILEKCKRKYGDKLIYWNNKVNKGIAYNSNLAYSMASGDYIALVGDDDLWIDKSKIDKQLQLFQEANERLGIVGTWWVEKSSNLEIKRMPQEPKNWKKRLLKKGGIICGSTPLISREAWDSVNGFDERMIKGTDSDLFRAIVLNNYTAKILQEITTEVDVNTNRKRMTPVDSRKYAMKILFVQLYVLRKYFFYYLLYPSSLFYRTRRILVSLTQLILINK